MNIPVDAWYDSPRIIDWKYSDLVEKESGASTSWLSWKELSTHITFYNQYKLKETMNGCGWYGLTHAENAGRIFEDVEWGKSKQVDPSTRWIPRQDLRPSSLKYRWTSIQSNLDIFRSRKWISGNARCDWREESSRALRNGNMIYTGSDDCDRSKTYQTWVYHRAGKKTQWHLFFVFGEDTERGWFIMWDSNGPKFWPILIKYEDRDSLYSKNAIFLESSHDLILKYRSMSQPQKEFDVAKELGITNGTDPKWVTLREQSAIMALRAYVAAQKDTDAKLAPIKEQLNKIEKLMEEVIKKLK